MSDTLYCPKCKTYVQDGDACLCDLEKPACVYGYTDAQVRRIMSGNLANFYKWMNGQTMSVCEGKECDRPHGAVVYAYDLERFLMGRNHYKE